MHVVLVNPLIPHNTGSIARLCAGTFTELHLVGELGFSLDDRFLKRAGLDYWPNVVLHRHPDFETLLQEFSPKTMSFLSSHAKKSYREIPKDEDGWLVFGSETKGLPKSILEAYPDAFYTIPMSGHTRSLNLAMSTGIVLFDALAALDFPGLKAGW